MSILSDEARERLSLDLLAWLEDHSSSQEELRREIDGLVDDIEELIEECVMQERRQWQEAVKRMMATWRHAVGCF